MNSGTIRPYGAGEVIESQLKPFFRAERAG